MEILRKSSVSFLFYICLCDGNGIHSGLRNRGESMRVQIPPQVLYKNIRKEVKSMVTVNMPATGANIKTMMKARNIKVKDIQVVCGFGTPQAIFKWMRGDCMPTIDNMIIIADMFGCKMDDIVVVDR